MEKAAVGYEPPKSLLHHHTWCCDNQRLTTKNRQEPTRCAKVSQSTSGTTIKTGDSSMGHRLRSQVLNSLQRIQDLQLLETRLRVQVLHGIVERAHLARRIDLDLGIHGPLVDGLFGDASCNHGLAKAVLAAALVEPVHAL